MAVERFVVDEELSVGVGHSTDPEWKAILIHLGGCGGQGHLCTKIKSSNGNLVY
jgi:hypothetical protein